jgi:hypothetical protein
MSYRLAECCQRACDVCGCPVLTALEGTSRPARILTRLLLRLLLRS